MVRVEQKSNGIPLNQAQIQKLKVEQKSKMTPEQFCYWLQGFMEITEVPHLDQKQTQIVKDHLALVFEKVTPIIPITTMTWKTTSNEVFDPNPTPKNDPLPGTYLC